MICNRRKAFVFATAKLLYEYYCKGYDYETLHRLMRHSIRPRRTIYGTPTKLLIRLIEARFEMFCRSGLAYLEHPIALPYYNAHRNT